MDKMQKYYNDLFEYGNKENIYKIPKEYQTQEMWNEFVNETHTCPAYIPKEFQNKDFINVVDCSKRIAEIIDCISKGKSLKKIVDSNERIIKILENKKITK